MLSNRSNLLKDAESDISKNLVDIMLNLALAWALPGCGVVLIDFIATVSSRLLIWSLLVVDME